MKFNTIKATTPLLNKTLKKRQTDNRRLIIPIFFYKNGYNLRQNLKNCKIDPELIQEALYYYVNSTYGKAKENLSKYNKSNEIRTTKYHIFNNFPKFMILFTFIPKNLWEQFHRIANCYFLLICVMNFCPKLEVINPVLALAPIAVVLCITLIKDAFDEIGRLKNDRKLNDSVTQVYNFKTNKYENAKWKNLQPGDILLLLNNETIPADVLLLASYDHAAGNEGDIHEGELISKPCCYVETMNLDGETNLKQKTPVDWDSFQTAKPSTNNRRGSSGSSPKSASLDRKTSLHSLSTKDSTTSLDCSPKDSIKSKSSNQSLVSKSQKRPPIGQHVNFVLETEHPSPKLDQFTGVIHKVDRIKRNRKPNTVENSFKNSPVIEDGNFYKINPDGYKPLDSNNNSNTFCINQDAHVINKQSKRIPPAISTFANYQTSAKGVNYDNLLLRGCKIKNTTFIEAMVVFTGSDTKVIIGADKSRKKVSSVEKHMNIHVMILLLMLVICSIVIAVGNIFNINKYTSNTWKQATLQM